MDGVVNYVSVFQTTFEKFTNIRNFNLTDDQALFTMSTVSAEIFMKLIRSIEARFIKVCAQKKVIQIQFNKISYNKNNCYKNKYFIYFYNFMKFL